MLAASEWKHGVIDQIYPRSFLDTNGDGIGGLEGIIERLDYLASLQIDAIRISPMADFGDEITNHSDIAPVFGELARFMRLLDEAVFQPDEGVIVGASPGSDPAT